MFKLVANISKFFAILLIMLEFSTYHFIYIIKLFFRSVSNKIFRYFSKTVLSVNILIRFLYIWWLIKQYIAVNFGNFIDKLISEWSQLMRYWHKFSRNPLAELNYEANYRLSRGLED